MTLSQIIRGCRWEDVLRYLNEINASRGVIIWLISDLCEPLFYELQAIEPQGSGAYLRLFRSINQLWVCNKTRHKWDSCIALVSDDKIPDYMWSHYLGAEVEDWGNTNMRSDGCYSTAVHKKQIEEDAMPDAAIVANVIIKLSYDGYSQAEAEDNIKRRQADSSLGYNINITKLTQRKGLPMMIDNIKSKFIADGYLERLMEGAEDREMMHFTTYFSTNFGWSWSYRSQITADFSDRIVSYSNRSLTLITYPRSFDISKTHRMINQVMFVPSRWKETVYIDVPWEMDYVQVDVYAY